MRFLDSELEWGNPQTIENSYQRCGIYGWFDIFGMKRGNKPGHLPLPMGNISEKLFRSH
jgi:hypothetical protein